MSNVKNLFDDKAIEKLKKITESSKTCLFCTDLSVLPINARPMSVSEIDDNGDIWFISSKQSNKNFEIFKDNKVQLFFTNTKDNEFLSLYGEAKIYTDTSIIEKLWTPIAKAWFNQGKDDPDVSVICVKPNDAYYWDSESGKVISLLKIAAQAVTGLKMNIGREGKLKF
ncbi:pyridoxamine 5'-phosphate oxidase family protein [Confluentibacter citreus]|uniref:pyridoxamine 5'-phosphate oxidase family protein n=1 Tax=Confluentibacter citreus TaxID=2007307 RepID=UPI000C287720|nr:pyridoxamine 5'-phosphate oxidase family protein [Confluentibacter citreus]